MAGAWPTFGRPIDGRLAVCATLYGRLPSIIGNINGRLLAYFRACFRLDCAWFCRGSGRIEVNRPGPALNGIEPEYTRLHTRLLWYYRQLLAHTSAFQNTLLLRLPSTVALRLYDERFVCSGCFRRLR